MTLSNIFFGKKVVQKAYLNNALIYQSKGWQTLPSTCTEVWTKSYEKVGSIRAITKDDSDNIYIGADQYLYKMDPDGNLKWKYAVSAVTAIVTFPTYLYCSYFINNSSGVKGYLAKIDINGNLISTVETNSFLPTSTGNYIVDMQRDNDYIYAISGSYIFKLDFNLKLIDYASIPYSANCIRVSNGPYVFVGLDSNSIKCLGIKFLKNNLKNSTNLISTRSFSCGSLIVDSIGNVYLGSNSENSIYKFDAENCNLLEARFLGYNGDQVYNLYGDTQDNLYVVYYNGTNYLLRKYSSDGTLIWDNVQIPTTTSYASYTKVITDSNNNIYVAYMDSNGMLTIRKLINLVKET